MASSRSLGDNRCMRAIKAVSNGCIAGARAGSASTIRRIPASMRRPAMVASGADAPASSIDSIIVKPFSNSPDSIAVSARSESALGVAGRSFMRASRSRSTTSRGAAEIASNRAQSGSSGISAPTSELRTLQSRRRLGSAGASSRTRSHQARNPGNACFAPAMRRSCSNDRCDGSTSSANAKHSPLSGSRNDSHSAASRRTPTNAFAHIGHADCAGAKSGTAERISSRIDHASAAMESDAPAS